MNQKKTTQSGFGLIEVIVSITIMTSIVIALTYLSQAAFRTWETAQSKTIAYSLLQRSIEEIHNLRDKNFASGPTWDTGLESAPNKTDTVNNKEFTTSLKVEDITATVDGLQKDGLMKKVTVTVTWRDRMKEGKLEGATYLTDWKSKY